MSVFGQMKFNMAYHRFRHFGKDNVTMDFALFALAFNIKKCAKIAGQAKNEWYMPPSGLFRISLGFYQLTIEYFGEIQNQSTEKYPEVRAKGGCAVKLNYDTASFGNLTLCLFVNLILCLYVYGIALPWGRLMLIFLRLSFHLFSFFRNFAPSNPTATHLPCMAL